MKTGYIHWVGTIVLLTFPSFYGSTQEVLEDILRRGYISQWLICGPFETDRVEGIKKAIRNNQPPLGTRDFWGGYGGITQILPQRDSQFIIDRKMYRWTPFTANSALIDISKIAENLEECVFFFASYFQATNDQILYINLHTPLGARLWISKTQLIDLPPKFNIDSAGIDRALVRIKKGLNLIILQVPFVSIRSLSEVVDISPSELQTKFWLEKEPSIGKTGFEFFLRVLPILQVGKIFYVPELRPTRIFTRTKISPNQVFYLTLFNPYPERVFPVHVLATLFSETNPIFDKDISLLSKEEKLLEIEVPTSFGGSEKSKKSLRIIISAPDEKLSKVSAEFSSEVDTLPPELESKVFLITGIYGKYGKEYSIFEGKETQLDWEKRQAMYAYDNPHYGVDLGPGCVWLGMLKQSPEMLLTLKEIVSRGKTSAQNGFGIVEDWFVHSETLIRNLQWGTKLKQCLLNDYHNIYNIWDTSGISPRTPQILASFSIPGTVSNFENLGNPSIHKVYSPGGESIFLRNLSSPPAFTSINEIKKWVHINHEPVKELLPEIDILVVKNYTSPPLPALLTDLSMHIPPYFVQGNGVSEFFEEIEDYLYTSGKIQSVPSEYCGIFDRRCSGDFYYNGIHQYLLSKLEQSILQSEKVSTFASLGGGKYPSERLAKLWANVIIASDPELFWRELSFEDTVLLCENMLRQWRTAEKLKLEELSKVAKNVNALAHSPVPNREPIPILVFNSNSFRTSEPVFIGLTKDAGDFPSGRLYTANGEAVPFLLHTKRFKYSSVSQKVLEFVCENIPPMGTKLYLWVPDNYIPSETATNDMFIENDFLLIKFDSNGDIVEIKNKADKESLRLVNGGLDSLGTLTTDLGDYQSITEVPTSIRSFKSELKQRLEIQFSTQWGSLIKEYCLYKRLPYLYCSYNFRVEDSELSSEASGKLILATKFSSEVINKNGFIGAPLFGTYLNLNKKEVVPVNKFIFTGCKKFITTKSKGMYPISEFTVIKFNDEIDYSPLREAMWRMGIPSREISVNGNNLAPLTGILKDAFLVWAGSLGNLSDIRNILGVEISEEMESELRRREEIGSAFLTSCIGESELLGFTGKDVSKVYELLNNFINMVEKYSEFAIADSFFNVNTSEPNHPLLILFDGAKFAKMGKRGDLYLISGVFEFQPFMLPLISCMLSYRVLPFMGNLKESEILKMANEDPLIGIATKSQGGQWLPEMSFLDIGTDEAVVLSVKPVGVSHPLVEEEVPNPRVFCTFRVGSISSEPTNLKLDSALGIKNSALIGLNESDTGVPISPDKGISIDPWEMNTIRVAFEKVKASRDSIDLDSADLSSTDGELTHSNCNYIGDIFYPLTGMTPVSLGMKLNRYGTSTKVEIILSNLYGFEEVSGRVKLEVKKGSSVGPSEINYNLPPLTTVQYFIDYSNSNPGDNNDYIRAWTELAGVQTYACIAPEHFPCEVSISKEESKIMVNLENKIPITTVGYIAITVGDYDSIKYNFCSLEKITPMYSEFELAPEAKESFTFSLLDDLSAKSILVYIRANEMQKVFIP